MRAAEEGVRERLAQTGRSCGSCSLCCKLLTISPVEPDSFSKAGYVWCAHCKVGQGCGIYAQRPAACRAFACEWLINSKFGEEWYPLRSKMLLYEATERTGNRLHIVVDSGSPSVWRREPFHSGIMRLMQSGLRGNAGRFYYTVVHYGRTHSILLFPNKECDAGVPGVVVQTGENAWDVIPCDSEESVAALCQKMESVAHRVARLSFSERYKVYLGLREQLNARQES